MLRNGFSDPSIPSSFVYQERFRSGGGQVVTGLFLCAGPVRPQGGSSRTGAGKETCPADVAGDASHIAQVGVRNPDAY